MGAVGAHLSISTPAAVRLRKDLCITQQHKTGTFDQGFPITKCKRPQRARGSHGHQVLARLVKIRILTITTNARLCAGCSQASFLPPHSRTSWRRRGTRFTDNAASREPDESLEKKQGPSGTTPSASRYCKIARRQMIHFQTSWKRRTAPSAPAVKSHGCRGWKTEAITPRPPVTWIQQEREGSERGGTGVGRTAEGARCAP